MTYSELLQQKEWWSKCNEILQRDHFICKDCGSVGFHNGGSFIKLDRIEEWMPCLKDGFSMVRYYHSFGLISLIIHLIQLQTFHLL